MQGTPFIYQGQEIGMTNVKYSSIGDYNDVATKNKYQLKKAEGATHEEIMDIIWATSRDNSRTPMHWSDKKNAGFTTGTPWLKVNSNYSEINVDRQQQDKKSILHFYKKMISLKKANPVFTYGTYDLVLEDNPQIYAYTRTLNQQDQVVVLTNFSAKDAVVSDKLGYSFEFERLLLNNYDVVKHEPVTSINLKPYETRIYRI
jgi:alpha-glucosidase